MTTQVITLHVPTDIYQRIEQMAQSLQQPLETFLLNTVMIALPADDDLPPDVTVTMIALTRLDDAALWQEAGQVMSLEKQAQLTRHLDKQQQDTLTEDEKQTLTALVNEYQHIILTRAQAAVLLKQRGYDVSDPTVFNQSRPTL